MEFSQNGWISVPSGMDEGGIVQVAVLGLILLGIVAAGLWGRPGRRRSSGQRWNGRSWGKYSPRSGRGPARVLKLDSSLGASPLRGDRFDTAAEQMRVVGESNFEKVPLLNREEERLLPILEGVVREVGQGHRVMAQTSLGEVIRPVAGSSDRAYAAINSKRLDFAIFDRRGLIVCAVEYQGTGHWQGQAAMRDAVKREALRKAGVRVVEVHTDFVEATLAQALRDLLIPAARQA